MTHPTRAFSGSIINRFTGSKILARVGQISVAFPHGAHFVVHQKCQVQGLCLSLEALRESWFWG